MNEEIEEELLFFLKKMDEEGFERGIRSGAGSKLGRRDRELGEMLRMYRTIGVQLRGKIDAIVAQSGIDNEKLPDSFKHPGNRI